MNLTSTYFYFFLFYLQQRTVFSLRWTVCIREQISTPDVLNGDVVPSRRPGTTALGDWRFCGQALSPLLWQSCLLLPWLCRSWLLQTHCHIRHPPRVRSAHSWLMGRGNGNQPAHFSGQADRAVILKRSILLGRLNNF